MGRGEFPGSRGHTVRRSEVYGGGGEHPEGLEEGVGFSLVGAELGRRTPCLKTCLDKRDFRVRGDSREDIWGKLYGAEREDSRGNLIWI